MMNSWIARGNVDILIAWEYTTTTTIMRTQYKPAIYCISNEQYSQHEIKQNNRQNVNKRHALVGNKIVDHSDVVGESPIGVV